MSWGSKSRNPCGSKSRNPWGSKSRNPCGSKSRNPEIQNPKPEKKYTSKVPICDRNLARWVSGLIQPKETLPKLQQIVKNSL